MMRPRQPGHEATPEYWIAELWRELLDTQRVDSTDDFVRLGGDSLLAMRMLARLQEEFGVRMSLRSFFDNPTVSATAGFVRAHKSPSAQPTASSLSVLPSSGRDAPVTAWQRQRLLRDRWKRTYGVPDYSMHIPLSYRLRGEVEFRKMDQALTALVQRHPALRTALGLSDGKDRFVQRVLPPFEVRTELHDLRSLPAASREHAARALLVAARDEELAVSDGQLFRSVACRVGSLEYRWLWVLDHLACDGWSIAVLIKELSQTFSAAVQNRDADLPRIPITFSDLVAERTARLSEAKIGQLIDAWSAHLAGLSPLPELTLDFAANGEPPLNYKGGVESTIVQESLVRHLIVAGGRRGATLHMVLLAAVAAVVRRHSRDDRVALLVAAAHRDDERTRQLVGWLADLLVVPVDVRPANPFVDLLDRVRDSLLWAYEHADLQWSTLLERLDPRVFGRPFQRPMLVFGLQEGVPGEVPRLPGIEVEEIGLGSETTRPGLDIHGAYAGNLTLFVSYEVARYDPRSARRFLAEIVDVLRVAANS